MDGPGPFSLERMLGSAGLTRDLSAVPGTMGKVSFVALTALGRGEGRVRAAGEGVPLKRRRTMCEKPRLWVSHTDHYVPPTPLWERQLCSDQPTADPALIGFFFFSPSLCSQGTKILLWRERRGVPAVPLPRTDWLCHEMAKSTRINARPTCPERGRVRPFGPASVSGALGAGKGGDPEGQATTFLIFIIPPPTPSSPHPRPCRDVYSWTTSAGWRTHLSLSLSLDA